MKHKQITESAVMLEEEIINLFPELKTEIYKGCILKESDKHCAVYPLYCNSDEYVSERIQICEEICAQKGLSCEFHIIEHTNYYLASLLIDNGYMLCRYGVIGEIHLTEAVMKEHVFAENKTYEHWYLKERTDGAAIQNVMYDADTVIGMKRNEFLFLPNLELPCGITIEDVIQFCAQIGVTRVAVHIPDQDCLPNHYEQKGVEKIYLYKCYQKGVENECKNEKFCIPEDYMLI